MATKYHKPVARAASLAAALALTIPLAPLAASASKSTTATAVRGTVVATNTARHTLVLAAGRAMDTVRFQTAGAVAKVALGTRMTVRASRLADGTFKALSTHAQGRVDRTTLHGTVVSAAATQLVLSAGGSTFSVDRGSAVATVASKGSKGRQSHASGASLGVGTDVRVGVIVRPTGLDATSITETGQSGFIGLEGTLASVSATSLVINVQDGATTTVMIPSSITIPPTIKATDQVELLAAYANGTFTLVTITDDSIAANQSNDGVSTDQNGAGYIQAEGLVMAYTPAASGTTTGSLIVQPGDGVAAMTFAVPGTVTATGLQIGSRVHVTATVSGTTLTVVSVRVQQSEGEGNGSMTTQTEGLVLTVAASTATAPGSLEVQPGDGVTPVSFVVPVGLDVSSIASGARVHVTGTFVNGQLTLQSFRVQQSEGNQGGPSGIVQIDGTVSGLVGTSGAVGSLTILPSDGATPVTISIPAALDTATLISTYVGGMHVSVTATMVNNLLTLVSIAPND
ncbi:MAG: hypothetical protein ACYDEH_05445 [Acidimicrobiales bacterium]